MSLTRILVATDLSATSLLSLPWVAGLARATGASVTVAFVDSGAAGLHGDDFDEAAEQVREHMGLFRDALHMLDVDADLRVLSGKPADALQKVAERGEYDLLVTTRHGERATGLLVGSTSLHLARTSAIPLLVVHGPANDEPPLERTTVAVREIVITTDFSEVANEGLRALQPLATALGANLHIVHVVETAGARVQLEGEDLLLPPPPRHAQREVDAARTRLQVLADGLAHERVSTEVVCAEVAADGVVATAIQRQSQLIAVCSHGKGRIASLLLGSTSRRILTLSPLPVLVLRQDAIGGPAWRAS